MKGKIELKLTTSSASGPTGLLMVTQLKKKSQIIQIIVPMLLKMFNDCMDCYFNDSEPKEP